MRNVLCVRKYVRNVYLNIVLYTCELKYLYEFLRSNNAVLTMIIKKTCQLYNKRFAVSNCNERKKKGLSSSKHVVNSAMITNEKPMISRLLIENDVVCFLFFAYVN